MSVEGKREISRLLVRVAVSLSLLGTGSAQAKGLSLPKLHARVASEAQAVGQGFYPDRGLIRISHVNRGNQRFFRTVYLAAKRGVVKIIDMGDVGGPKSISFVNSIRESFRGIDLVLKGRIKSSFIRRNWVEQNRKNELTEGASAWDVAMTWTETEREQFRRAIAGLGLERVIETDDAPDFSITVDLKDPDRVKVRALPRK